MTDFRLLERQTPEGSWFPDGVAYAKGNLFLFFRGAQTLRLHVEHLRDLDENHFPYEEHATFRWASIQVWDPQEAFAPENALSWAQQRSSAQSDALRNRTPEQVAVEVRALLALALWNENEKAKLRAAFAHFIEKGYPLYPQLVEAIWRQWPSSSSTGPFVAAEHNVALLLYARAFDFPVDDYPSQVNYLKEHADLYAPLFETTGGWGPRASLAGGVKTLLDSPVMNVWVYKDQSEIHKMLIVGKGLRQFQDQLFTDFLLTAMRVQANPLDVINSGVVSIERHVGSIEARNIALPVMGANAPLRDVETATAAFQQLLNRLKQLSRETGFVQIHEIDARQMEGFKQNLLDTMKDALLLNKPILWAPESGESEIVLLEPLRELPRQQPKGELVRPPLPVEIEIGLDLFHTEKWLRLMKACQEDAVNTIYFDAMIKLDYYRKRIEALTAEKKRWDTADEDTRQAQWGPSITLNQRFDDETGLTVWLQRPTLKSTKEYFEEIVPILIDSHQRWAGKMESLISDLKAASEREDKPFTRLLMSRLFDSAIRGQPITGSPRVQRRYQAWVEPVADLLNFLLRYHFGRTGTDWNELFNAHTTFALFANIGERNRIYLQPQTLIDARSSIVIVDPQRSYVIVKDPTDLPAPDQHPGGRQEIDILRNLSGEWKELQPEELTKALREALIENPGLLDQVLKLLGPQIDTETLERDKSRIKEIQHKSQTEALQFVRLIDRATNATISYGQLTMMESLEGAHRVIPDVIQRWQELRARAEEANRNLEYHKPVLDQKKLECRLYLLKALYLCLLSGKDPKEHLPAILASHVSMASEEIRQALEAAEQLDPEFTKRWFDFLGQWELIGVLSMLRRDLPSEDDLLDSEQTHVASVFDVFDLITAARYFRDAMVELNPDHEIRASAYLKLGQAIENAMVTYAVSTVSAVDEEVRHLLEILTGRELTFKRGL